MYGCTLMGVCYVWVYICAVIERSTAALCVANLILARNIYWYIYLFRVWLFAYVKKKVSTLTRHALLRLSAMINDGSMVYRHLPSIGIHRTDKKTNKCQAMDWYGGSLLILPSVFYLGQLGKSSNDASHRPSVGRKTVSDFY